MAKYYCNYCQDYYEEGVVCPHTILKDKEKYQQHLEEAFNSFSQGYGEDILVILSTLRRKLFGKGLFDDEKK